MTIAQLAHQDSTELTVALLGFDAWLADTAPTSEEWDKILHDMQAEDDAIDYMFNSKEKAEELLLQLIS